MATRCVWVLLFVLLTIAIPKISCVRVLVLRGDNTDSRSEEDRSDSLDAGESEEIDFLLDLIQKESRERNPPPVTSVKIIKRKPDVQLVAQHSIRKERVESYPKDIKEYHIHYHNHQHKEPPKPLMAFDDDGFPPVMWDPQLSLDDYDSFKQLQKSPSSPYSESSRIKSFKDFDSFLKSSLRSSYPSDEKHEPEVRFHAAKDFETIIKPKMSSYMLKDATPFERIKKFQDFMDSDEDKAEFLNKERFAGFKDFSEIESPPDPKTKTEEKSEKPEKTNSESPEKRGLKIRDFAIVIKSKPRATDQNKGYQGKKHASNDEHSSPGPHIPPFVNKLRIPQDKRFVVPRVLEAAGGTPKYIDRINQMKYPPVENFDMPFGKHFNANRLENDQRFFHINPLQAHAQTQFPVRNQVNGWLLRRLMR